jgi:hypothetical protein
MSFDDGLYQCILLPDSGGDFPCLGTGFIPLIRRLWKGQLLFPDARLGGGLDVRGADGDDGRRGSADGRGCAGGVGGEPGRPRARDARPGMPAVHLLRAGLDRGLAGSGDLAGQAAAAGRHADDGARGDRVAESFDVGESRTLPWARRPQAAALVAALAAPDRGWDAIVIGEYERAFYGNQYASMAPPLERYGIQLWMPEVGGRVDWHAEDHEETMLALGLSSKREITRTRVRVRTAMAAQTREQGRYLVGRPPYGYRLADAGPHPNKAHAAWGRRAHKLEPDPVTAPVVSWMFAQRLAGHSAARITRALNDAGVPCPSAADPGRNPHRMGTAWTLRTAAAILANPRTPGGRYGTGSGPISTWLTPPTPPSGTGRCSGGTCPKAGSSPGIRRIRRIRRWSARLTS